MPDDRKVLGAFMMSLIRDVGGYDAACAIIEARWGEPISKGTLTKKKQGQLAWSITDMIALQEAAGRSPVTAWLVSLEDEADAAACIVTENAEFARETGEAIAAVISAKTPEQKAKAIKELRDVTASAERLVDALEAGQ